MKVAVKMAVSLFLVLCCGTGMGLAEDPASGSRVHEVVKQQLPTLKQAVNDEYESLFALYQHFHSHPELSLQEEKTAARVATELREAGFDVTEKVGGFGVVGVFKNGTGPTVMVRADMDALPIVENTGLPYASKVMTRNRSQQQVGVMHACGHDMNITCLVGTARMLTKLKDHWQGTLVFVGQPAEELGLGAKMMLADGLFQRFPRPDFCLATHCDARYPHGHVNYRLGQMQANVDSVDITVRGKGGHGAAPHVTKDPVVIAARMILDFQTIASREVNPLNPVVVTVGSIHGGTKHNIIPNSVKLELTVRTTTDEVRKQVLSAIVRIAKAASLAAGAPAPEVKVHPDYTPSLVNNVKLGEQTVQVFKAVLGDEFVHQRPMSLGGEDFSQFIRAGVPGFYYFVGTAPPEKVSAAKAGGPPLSKTHTDAYYPVPEPTLKTGVLTMTSAVLNLLGKSE